MQAAPYSTTFVGGLDEESPDTRPSEICNYESDNLAGHLAHPSATVLVEYVQIVSGCTRETSRRMFSRTLRRTRCISGMSRSTATRVFTATANEGKGQNAVTASAIQPC